MSQFSSNRLLSRLSGAIAVLALGAALAATFSQTCFSSRQLSSNFVSPASWKSLVFPSQTSVIPISDLDSANIPFWPIFLGAICIAVFTWVGGALWLVLRQGENWGDALVRWGWYGWLWWILLDLWEWLWIAAGAVGSTNLVALLSATPQFWLAGCLAGWLTTFLTLQASSGTESVGSGKPLWAGWLWLFCGVYVIVFTTMNWRLYFNLLVPHGDSVMYEEHLWNLLHGRGFRSYLDRGLFLGEHIQFVHLFLLPLYVLWPSHLLIEASSTVALALGAFPVFWMTRRQTGSDRTALAVAAAYLFYAPMQFLDIEIDLKTFRPESFGIPLLLLTLDQLDRKSFAGTLVGMASCLSVKEDYTLIFGPLGVWIALNGTIGPRSSRSEQIPLKSSSRFSTTMMFGVAISLFSVIYLWLAMRVIMPWFRSGDEVHYASYFSRFGKTPEEILHSWLTHPSLLFESLLGPETGLYAVALLAPLAFLPLFAPGRLAVGLPLFAILCLNELEGSRTPQHQFHAPLVAIIFWALAAALPRAVTMGYALLRRLGANMTGDTIDPLAILRRLVWTSSFATGLFFSLSPLGIPFWDAGSSWYWQRLYLPNHRAAVIDRVTSIIPRSARVASTDFVHPRFTHYERSYDYSDYLRKVNGEGSRIPDDTEYIVIDTQHRYSKVKLPRDVPEFKEHPDRWELLPDETDGDFIVLKRK